MREKPWQPEKICVAGTCAVFDFDFSERTFTSLREKGFDAIVFGYLDANWDGEFSRIDMYSESEVLPEVIPHARVEKNRAELKRRLELAEKAGLSVYMSVRGPMTYTDLETLNPDAAKRYETLFGTGGDKWGGSGMRPFCLSETKVRKHYLRMFEDVETRFPQIKGFMFFGGDSYCLVCDDQCPKCAGKSEYLRWGEWIDELHADAQKRNSIARFDIMNWPWWDDMFDMIDHIDTDIGVVAVTNWGFSFGDRTDGKYPAITEPYELGEFQWDCLHVQKTDHGTAKALTQGWFNAPISDSFKKLTQKCKAQGRRIIGWTELVCSEAVWPYFLPSPATTIERLSELRELDVDGVFDLWGIAADMIYDRHIDANLSAFQTFFRENAEDMEQVLLKTANQLYGNKGSEWAVKAWKALDDALASWGIIAYCQRMHWTLRRFFVDDACSFYVLDLTLNLEKDPHLHFIPMWPEFLLKPETWDRLKANLTHVIEGYDKALSCYDRLMNELDGNALETAQFHEDSLLLGRTYQQMGLEACVYHAASLRKEKLDRDFMRSAVLTRRMCRLLYTKLGTVPVEHRIDLLLAKMVEYANDHE